MTEETRGDPADWQRPALEQHGLRRFLNTVRERIWIVAGTVVLATLIAIAYAVTADDVYEAEADVLITPVPSDDQALDGLGLITESFDPTLDIQTAVQLIDTRAVAQRAAESLGGGLDTEQVQDQVKVEAVGQSNVIAVVADQPSADRSAELANAYADAAVAERTAVLEARIDEILPALRDQAAAAPAELGPEYRQRIVALESLEASGDPTIHVQNPAEPPDSPARPQRAAIVVLGLFGGLVAGIGLAFLVSLLDPRLRREEQLRERYRIPILARVPRERRTRKAPLSWDRLSGHAIESYRALRAILTASDRGGQPARSFMITGSGASEGKTTTAINLATSLAIAGARVILIEADLRRPAIGDALGVRPDDGVVGVLLGQKDIEDSLVTTPTLGANVQLLLAEQSGPSLAELFSLPTASRLIEEAKAHADFVVIDSPPLSEVIDALPLARDVDQVVIVTKIGRTRLARLKELGELLAGSGVRPAGFVIVAVPRPEGGSYYYYEESARRRRRGGGGSAGASAAPSGDGATATNQAGRGRASGDRAADDRVSGRGAAERLE